MEEYRGAAIFKSYVERQWYAVFGYGDHVTARTKKAAMAAVDARLMENRKEENMSADKALLDAVREVRKLSAETRVSLLAKLKRDRRSGCVSDMAADVLAYPERFEAALVEMIAAA